jgi:hypothetical protein
MRSGKQVPGFFILAIAFSACSPSPSDPAPATGYSQEKVDYAPPPLLNPTIVEVPPIALNEWPAEPTSFKAPATVKKGEALVFEGTIDMGDPKAVSGVVYIEFTRATGGDRKVITNTSQAMLANGENTDGIVRYRVEIRAPDDIGKQNIELRLLHIPTSTEARPFARSETNVQK